MVYNRIAIFFRNIVSAALLLSFAFPQPVVYATSYYAYDIEDELITEEEYGVFAPMLIEFEEIVDRVDDDLVPKGIFKKWGHKLKRWFKRRTRKMCKKFLKLAHCSNPEECAYTAAKTKRKIDKVYDTGSLDKAFGHFDKRIHKAKNPEAVTYFKKRVEFYYKNKHLKPKSLNIGRDYRRPDPADMPEDLQNMNSKQMWGCVVIFCGSLIAIIPFPGCVAVGELIVGTGVGMVVDGSFFEKGFFVEEDLPVMSN